MLSWHSSVLLSWLPPTAWFCLMLMGTQGGDGPLGRVLAGRPGTELRAWVVPLKSTQTRIPMTCHVWIGTWSWEGPHVRLQTALSVQGVPSMQTTHPSLAWTTPVGLSYGTTQGQPFPVWGAGGLPGCWGPKGKAWPGWCLGSLHLGEVRRRHCISG